jgi:hypothetical protein
VFVWTYSRDILFVTGTILLYAGISHPSLATVPPGGTPPPATVTIDTTAIDEATCWLYYFQEGPYGALLLAVTGIGALVSCAVGAYRACLNLLAVAVGSWLIRPVATILFDYNIADCRGLISGPRNPAGGGPTTGGPFGP